MRALRWAVLAAALAACGTQFSDPIRVWPDARGQDQDSGEGPSADACGQWSSAASCALDTAHGCSFQPNAVGCRSDDTMCGAGACLRGDPFVRRQGAILWLHDASFTFVGAVSWAGAGASGACRVTTLPADTALTQTFDDLAAIDANALRIWAFQSYAGASGTDYTRLDRVVADARRAGVRLIMVLENQNENCTMGGARDDLWYQSGYRAPYGGYALSYVDYVGGLVAHFRDEPTIFAWELVHGAEANDFALLDAFGRAMSAQIRTTAPNQLIAFGANGGRSPATDSTGEMSNFRRLHDHPEIDLVEVQDYDTPDTALTADMERARSIAAGLGKPVFAGATAVRLAAASASAYAARADLMGSKLESALGAGFVGFMVYDYYPAWNSPGWEFDGRSDDPLGSPMGTLARHAPPHR